MLRHGELSGTLRACPQSLAKQQRYSVSDTLPNVQRAMLIRTISPINQRVAFITSWFRPSGETGFWVVANKSLASAHGQAEQSPELKTGERTQGFKLLYGFSRGIAQWVRKRSGCCRPLHFL